MSNGPSFDVRIDLSRVGPAIETILKRAQFIVDEQVIKDSNYYIPQDQGILKDSVLSASSIGEGKVVWNTPYARKLYYNPQYNFSKDKNPNAQGLWFEAAKAAHKKNWIKMANQAIRGR
jgi:hypothetical protein